MHLIFLQSVALGELVAERLEAAVRLQFSPSNVVAMEKMMELWCQSLVKPGQFMGAKFVKPMSMKEHQTGGQAWVKKVCGWVGGGLCKCVGFFM